MSLGNTTVNVYRGNSELNEVGNFKDMWHSFDE